MRPTDPRTRRLARHAAALGVVASAVSMTLSLSALVSPNLAGAASVTATATIVQPSPSGTGPPLTTGDSNTAFTLRLPAGAACAADGTNGGRWHTYMVPDTEALSSLAFNGTGSLVGASTGSGGTGTFRNSLFSVAKLPVRGQAPNLNDAVIINIPDMDLKVWTTGQIPDGSYNLGIACVDLDATPASTVDHIWTARIQVAAATVDDVENPGGITWTALAVPSPSPSPSPSQSASPSPSPSPSRSASPSPSPSSSPTPSPSASPSVSPSPMDGPSPTQPNDPTAPSTSVLSAGASSGGGGSIGGGELPRTGGSGIRLVISGLLLVVFGRMVVLLGRPVSIVEVQR